MNKIRILRFWNIVFLLFIIQSVSAQNGNVLEQAQRLQTQTFKFNSQGRYSTTPGGYSFQAFINGKPWIASSMVSPALANRIVAYQNNFYLGFAFEKKKWVQGESVRFNEDNTFDFFIRKGDCLYKTMDGRMNITTVSKNWITGTFSCQLKCANNSNLVTITGGTFKVPANAL